MRELAGRIVSFNCHRPRRRAIQYAAAFRLIASAAGYWITRFRG
jgi:hypothetical protein